MTEARRVDLGRGVVAGHLLAVSGSLQNLNEFVKRAEADGTPCIKEDTGIDPQEIRDLDRQVLDMVDRAERLT